MTLQQKILLALSLWWMESGKNLTRQIIFVLLSSVGVVLGSPILIVCGILWILHFSYRFWKFIIVETYERMSVVLFCTSLGLVFGLAFGSSGAMLAGGLLGLFIGFSYKLTEWQDKKYEQLTTVVKYPSQKRHWAWEGFQVSSGPREDSILRG